MPVPTERMPLLVCLLALALALAGCGASTPSSTSSPSGPVTTASSTSSATASSSTSPAASSTATTTSTTTSAATRHHGGGNSLPAAPDGLRATTGYAGYERCQGACTGAVPAALRRPLQIPAASGPCPVTLTVTGPVSVPVSAQVGFARVSGSTWLTAPVTWRATPAYGGPLLIRGRELGSATPVGFGTGATPYDELQLLDAGQGAPPGHGGRAWRTIARVPAAGCYAYQVDGTSFSAVIVFRAVG